MTNIVQQTGFPAKLDLSFQRDFVMIRENQNDYADSNIAYILYDFFFIYRINLILLNCVVDG
jgi:hypothetical protein